ncbi:MAG: alpha/beta hydrolase [Pirellulales bacterium]|nr:alpha/beta hydrolase [Pirellulales bacterium]
MRRASTNWLALILLEGLFLILLSYSHANSGQGFFDIGSKTLGGRMIFSDEVVYHGWRIQKNSLLGHYRLLEPDDSRYTFGSLEHCLEELEKVKIEKELPPMPEEVVIVVHGLGAYRHWMNPLSEFLAEEGGFVVINVGYPSTKGEIGEHAASLMSVIQHLDGVEKINFVAHSMGNIVIRHCLNDLASLPVSQQPDITYGRFVMLAPPNHGATAAEKLADNKLAQIFGGDAVQQLAPNVGWPNLEKQLATPNFEFGIIVGGVGDDEGYLAGIPGDDDMLLSVETSKLAGASDFAQVKGIHQTLPKNEQVQQYVLRFLQTGAFMPSGRRYPIDAVESPTIPAR